MPRPPEADTLAEYIYSERAEPHHSGSLEYWTTCPDCPWVSDRMPISDYADSFRDQDDEDRASDAAENDAIIALDSHAAECPANVGTID